MSNCACSASLHPIGPLDPLQPVLFFVELTHVCNNACPGCGNVFDHGSSRSPLSAREWRNIFAQLTSLQPRFRLTGGEPTLHPEFSGIIGHVKEMGFPFSVFTNAQWQDPERIIELLLEAFKLDYILVSLHGARTSLTRLSRQLPGHSKRRSKTFDMLLSSDCQ